jgi:aldehyde dehydrogenase (NAD+)
VYGTDLDRATAVARRLRTGTVSVNGGMYYGPDSPFGGFKQSGFGREMGVAGLEEYLGIKTIATPA